MDPVKVQDVSTINSPEELQTSRTPLKGILRKSQTTIGRQTTSTIDRTAIKRTSTSQVKRVTRVTFSDKVKNIPICTVFEVEPISYDEPASPKGNSCACLLF
ncbi:hypothetical protein SteCoe_23582 [Stentor coeruleus]|uniref:Uncharacterized protein n=1 Tax=Stentor coeruleus TaxID=5963 RepID=A0A1R2BK18_9CILI|nr:hypothetical protein SteCoe_23582 [Stentor coeruleus]